MNLAVVDAWKRRGLRVAADVWKRRDLPGVADVARAILRVVEAGMAEAGPQAGDTAGKDLSKQQ